MEFAALREKILAERHLDIGLLPTEAVRRVVYEHVQHVGAADDRTYAALLGKDSPEYESLVRELVSTSSVGAYDRTLAALLHDDIVPRLAHATHGSDLRIWLPNCGASCLAVEVAASVRDALGDSADSRKVKIIATDSDAATVDTTRRATFSPGPRLHGWERQVDRLRQMIVFGVQDPATQPPYSGIDLIVCAGLLPALSQDTRDNVVSRFIHSLRRGGMLVAGRGESIGMGEDPPTRRMPYPVFTKTLEHTHELTRPRATRTAPVSDVREVIDQIQVPVILLSSTGKIAARNAAASNLFSKRGVRLCEMEPHDVAEVILAALSESRRTFRTIMMEPLDQWVGAVAPLPRPTAEGGMAVAVLMSTDSIPETMRADADLRNHLAQMALMTANAVAPSLSAASANALERRQSSILADRLYDRTQKLDVLARELRERNEELSRAQDELKHRERETRTLVENSPDVISRFDRQLRHTYVNAAITKVSGNKPEDHIGKRADELPQPDGVSDVWNASLRRVLSTGQENVLELAFPSLDGKRYYHVRHLPEFGEDGSVETVLSIARDITDLKETERNLRESLRREHRIANTLQRALLPPIERRIDGLDVGVRYKAAFGEAMVGGDFYHGARLSEDRYLLVLGDVAGKGLEAAVLGSMTKYMLMGFVSETPDPEITLMRLNDALVSYSTDVGFVTLVYILMDLRTCTAYYASAGHEPAVHLRAGTMETDLLPPTGRALGIMSGAKYRVLEVPLKLGDVVAIYTDGISDAGTPGEPLGAEGVARMVKKEVDRTPLQILEELHKKAVEMSGGKLRDDVATMLIKRRR